MKRKNKIRTCTSFLLGLVGSFLLLPDDAQASTLSQEGAEAYLEIITGYQQQYGTFTSEEDIVEIVHGLPTGVVFSHLIDMNNNGIDELAIFYVSDGSPINSGQGEPESFTCRLELWQFTDEEASLFYEEEIENQFMIQAGNNEFFFLEQNDKWKLFSISTLNNFSWSGYSIYSIELGGSLMGDHVISFTEVYAGLSFVETPEGEPTYEEVSKEFMDKVDSLSNYEKMPLFDITQGSMNPSIAETIVSSCVEALKTLSSAPLLGEDTTTGTTYPLHATYSEPTSADIAQSYLDVIGKITNEYGLSDGQSTGLVSTQLLDLDSNGTEELFLTYCTNSTSQPSLSSSQPTLVLEVWTMAGSKAIQTFGKSYTRSYAQPEYWSQDWRDVGFLHPYGEDNWVLYFAGGGGTDPYQGYDVLYSYSPQGFVPEANGDMSQNKSTDTTYFSGKMYDEYFHGSGATISKAMPEWYEGFKEIRETYLSDTGIELFYMDKSEFYWVQHSCETELEERVAQGVAQMPEVVIPSQVQDPQRMRATAYEEIITGYQTQYGIFTGEGTGVVQSFLGDFTGDGNMELYVSYVASWENMGYLTEEVTSEVWGMEGNQAVKLFETESYPSADHGDSISLLEKEGVYYIHTTMQGGDGIYFSIDGFEDGGFQKLFSYGYTTAGAEIAGISQDSNPKEFEAEWERLMTGFTLHQKISHDTTGESPTISALPLLAQLLAVPEGSDHYFGNPITLDGGISSNINPLPLSGTVLAIYTLDVDLFYVIVDVNGKQESRVVYEMDGSFGLLSSHTANLTYEALEQEKRAFVQFALEKTSDSSGNPSDTTGNSVNSSTIPNASNGTEVSSGDGNATLVMVLIGLVGVLVVTMVLVLKKKKDDTNPPTGA